MAWSRWEEGEGARADCEPRLKHAALSPISGRRARPGHRDTQMTDQTTSSPPAPAGASPGPRGARWILRLDPARRAALLLLATLLLLLVPFAAARLGWPALPLAAVTLLAVPARSRWGSGRAAREVAQE